MARLNNTTEKFIVKAVLVHNIQYDYSNVVYVDSKSKVIITCKKHGNFEQTPSSHLQGSGCPDCAKIKLSNKRTKSSAQFIEQAKLMHNNKYNYEKSLYTTGDNKIIITCSTHGDFEQSPNSHLVGNGCRLCFINNATNTVEEIIKRAKVTHNTKYNYSKTQYIKDNNKIIITCPVHGNFEQRASAHLRGAGCPTCGNLVISKANANCADEFIAKSKLVHGDKYNYENSIYANAKTKLIVICPIHGRFEQTPSDHLSGCGCPSCAVTGFDSKKPGILYYLKITTDINQVLYKIGITNRTVEARFHLKDLQKIEIVKQTTYVNGVEALAEETRIKRKYKEYRYKGPDILSSGNSELFTIDIMKIY